jgi:hypothetical protein
MVNISPKYWGRGAWVFLHSVTMAYPDNPTDSDKLNYKNFFSSIKHILPCQKCRVNYSKHLLNYPLTDKILSSRENLIDWLILIRNQTNISNNKPKIDYNGVVQQIENIHNTLYSSESISMKNKYIRFGIVLTFIFIISVIIIKPYFCKDVSNTSVSPTINTNK